MYQRVTHQDQVIYSLAWLWCSSDKMIKNIPLCHIHMNQNSEVICCDMQDLKQSLRFFYRRGTQQ